ncbi:bestrophin family protein [Rugamonas aquatica]|uniref:Bestrophin n=1 Tax=Rugamonas aquatica TaxID=2743357 RepID=A0A6A7N6T9_9BURK|nr:bestrophin family ion channel [Rugamonas aquatica]MQA40756.1 hypothetical protein [Rugamonas aquatica]
MIAPGRVRVVHLLHYIGRPLALFFAWDLAVTLIYLRVHYHFTFPALPLSLLGSALAIYLSFRNTAAYSRWWEARTLWGTMVNSSRNFAREIKILLPPETDALRKNLVLRHAAYVHALRLHLRSQSPWAELAPRLPRGEINRLRGVANVPNAILGRTAELVADQSGMDSVKLAAVSLTLSTLSNAQGGMERIKNTPFPQQYAVYPVLFTHLFCVLLPLGLVESLGIFTPLGSGAVGVLLLALLQIGNDMKNPFANTEHDVPLSTLTRAIEIDLRDGLDEPHGLTQMKIQDGILW